jgi:hypothetical protein
VKTKVYGTPDYDKIRQAVAEYARKNQKQLRKGK